MREEVQIAFENSNKQEVFIPTSVSQNAAENPVNSQEQHKVKRSSKDKTKQMTPIPQNCKCFFALIKPENAKNGKRQFFFYTKETVLIYDHDTKSIEVIPDDSSIFLEDRFLFIFDQEGKSRKFSLKVKREIFDSIISTQFPSTLRPFFLSYLASSCLPPVTNLTIGFLLHSVFTTEFLISFLNVPSSLMTPELVSEWIMATESNYDAIFEQLYREFLRRQCTPGFDIPEDSLISKIVSTILGRDEKFSAFVSSLNTSSDDIYAFYCDRLKNVPFRQQAKMTLFIIFHETMKVFGQKAALVALSKLIYEAGVHPPLLKDHAKTADQLYNLVYFSSSLDKRYVNLLFNALLPLGKQPSDYIPTRCTLDSYDAYELLLQTVTGSNVDYLTVLKNFERDYFQK